MRIPNGEFIGIPVPISLIDLARHLATRRHFVLKPCGRGNLEVLQVVAAPYGYAVTFAQEEEAMYLRYLGEREPGESTDKQPQTESEDYSCRAMDRFNRCQPLQRAWGFRASGAFRRR